MSARNVFERLGCPLPDPYAWAGAAPDNKRAAFTVWQDEVKRVNGENLFVIHPTWERRARVENEVNGDDRASARKMKEIAERALASGAECFGVIIKAVDENTLGTRKREWCDEREVVRLELRRDVERIVAKIIGREWIANIKR